jgi:hypothetical protein
MAYLRPSYGPWERHRSSHSLLFFVPVRSQWQRVRTLAAFAAEIRHERPSEINVVNHKVGKPPRHRLCAAIEESCLERMILFGEGGVWKAIAEFMAHYHSERNHQGLDNALMPPDVVPLTGQERAWSKYLRCKSRPKCVPQRKKIAPGLEKR